MFFRALLWVFIIFTWWCRLVIYFCYMIELFSCECSYHFIFIYVCKDVNFFENWKEVILERTVELVRSGPELDRFRVAAKSQKNGKNLIQNQILVFFTNRLAKSLDYFSHRLQLTYGSQCDFRFFSSNFRRT